MPDSPPTRGDVSSVNSMSAIHHRHSRYRRRSERHAHDGNVQGAAFAVGLLRHGRRRRRRGQTSSQARAAWPSASRAADSPSPAAAGRRLLGPCLRQARAAGPAAFAAGYGDHQMVHLVVPGQQGTDGPWCSPAASSPTPAPHPPLPAGGDRRGLPDLQQPPRRRAEGRDPDGPLLPELAGPSARRPRREANRSPRQ